MPFRIIWDKSLFFFHEICSDLGLPIKFYYGFPQFKLYQFIINDSKQIGSAFACLESRFSGSAITWESTILPGEG